MLQAVPSARLVVDTDAGTDDAVALVLALRSSARVEAITTVSGNVDVDQCVRNVSYVLELSGQAVPIYRGATAPLARPARPRASRHGDDGLGGLGLRSGHEETAAGSAADAIVRLARRHPQELTLVTLGPLTNVALALQQAPELSELLGRTVIMAGAEGGPGTVTPRAEFNVWSDPEAARAVVRSGLSLTLVPLDLSNGGCAFGADDQSRIDELQTPLAHFVASMCRASARRGRPGTPQGQAGLPDAIAMAVALNPGLIQRSGRYHVDVETAGELTEGETVVDRFGVLGVAPNVEIIEAVDAIRYKRMVLGACR